MLKQKLFDNFAHPRGPVGRLAGRIMAAKADNIERGRWAVAELAPPADARVLEIGYGPGVTLAHMAERLPSGHLIGVDTSEVMRAQAARRNREAIADGRLEVRVGDAQALDDDLTELDLVYGINVWQFWSDANATVAHLADRLVPGGRLALVYMKPPPSDTTAADAQPLLLAQFADAGLVDIEARTMRHEPPAVLVVGRRPG